MWHFETTTAPVIGGAIGRIKKETDEHINKIPGCLRKIALCRSDSPLWRELSMWFSNISQKRQGKT